MTILSVQNVSLADIQDEAHKTGKRVEEVGLRYATKENLAASLGVSADSLILTQDDFSKDGWIRQDATFEIEVQDDTNLASLIKTQQLDHANTFSVGTIARLQGLKTEDSAYVFYDAQTGKRKCEVKPSYSISNAPGAQVQATADTISIYAAETGSLLYTGNPKDPYSTMSFGDFADLYCKTNTIGFLPNNYDATVARMEKRMTDKHNEATVASR